jgi:hypothetical protein
VLYRASLMPRLRAMLNHPITYQSCEIKDAYSNNTKESDELVSEEFSVEREMKGSSGSAIALAQPRPSEGVRRGGSIK